MRNRIFIAALLVVAAAGCGQSPTAVSADVDSPRFDGTVQDSTARGPIGAGSGG